MGSLTLPSAPSAKVANVTLKAGQAVYDSDLGSVRFGDGETEGGKVAATMDVVAPAILKLGQTKYLTDYIPRALWPQLANYSFSFDVAPYLDLAKADGLTGSRLWLPEGGYGLSYCDLRGFQLVEIEGETRGGTIIKPLNLTGNVFDLGSATAGLLAQVSIHSLTVDSGVTPRTSGATFNYQNITDIWMGDYQIAGQFNAITLGVVTGRSLLGDAGLAQITNTAAGGVGILVDGDQTIVELIDILIQCNPAQAAIPIQIVNAHDVNIQRCSTTFAGSAGLLISPGAGQTVEQIWMKNNKFDTGAGHGIDISGAGTLRLLRSEADWAATNDLCGVHIGSGFASVSDISFDHLDTVNNGHEGIWAEKCNGLKVQSGQAAGNSTAASNTYDGIRLGAAVDRFRIDTVTAGSYGQFVNSQRYGINIEAGSRYSYRVLDPDLDGNGTGTLLDNGTATNGKTIRI